MISFIKAILNFKKFHGFLLYFGSNSYLYQRMPMELNISPGIWHFYINAGLTIFKVENDEMQSLMVYYCSHEVQNSHGKIARLPKGISQTELKVFPKKCQLFRK